jgi:hypothetical protein
MSAGAMSARPVVGTPASASPVDVVLAITTSSSTNAPSAASDAADEGGWTTSGSTMNVHAGGGGGGGMPSDKLLGNSPAMTPLAPKPLLPLRSWGP